MSQELVRSHRASRPQRKCSNQMSQELVHSLQASQSQHLQSQSGPMVFGYIYEKNNMELFDNRIKQYVRNGTLPDLEVEAEYTIYRWKSGFGKHESIVIGCRGKFLTLEINVGVKITLYTTAEGIKEESLKECAQLISTGFNLIKAARNVYSDMKPYNIVTNNCQDFVNQFLIEIGMKDKVNETDSFWSLKTLGTVAAAGFGLLLTYSLSKDKSKK